MPHLLGGVQTIEKEKECSDVEKSEESGRSKSETQIEMEAVAIEIIERVAEDLRRDHEKGQNWISVR
jgi:hypothetical protein